MLFNSIEFLLFLPIVFCLYWLAARRLKLQNAIIVIASYVFYGWWDWRFLILIAISSICAYVCGLLIERSEGNEGRRKVISISNVVINIAILGFFKYFNFFTENLAVLLSPMGISLDNITVNVLLPVGISFYTFQGLSYTIDVYNRKIQPTRDVIAFFAYISFFPQLVAGPIERATNLLPQMLRRREFQSYNAVDGLRQILWGFFKKMIVADNCAEVANLIFSNYESYNGANLLVGAICFTFQIYGDFSGYSDIAIGTARLFGVNLMQNFKCPYFSRDIAEFWRRWHISLSTWFRDYIYIPLGGSREGKVKAVRNTIILFLVSGLWHGANWTFVLWGAYNALLFIPLLLVGKNRKYTDVVASGRLFPSFIEMLKIAGTFVLVTIGWILFRSESVGQAVCYFVRMISEFELALPDYGRTAMVGVLIMLLIEWLQRTKQHGFEMSNVFFVRYPLVRWSMYIALSLKLLLTLLHQPQTQFIYFQF